MENKLSCLIIFADFAFDSCCDLGKISINKTKNKVLITTAGVVVTLLAVR